MRLLTLWLILTLGFAGCMQHAPSPIQDSISLGPHVERPGVVSSTNPAPQVIDFPLSSSNDQPQSIVSGYDRNIWVGVFNQYNGNSIFRYSMDGAFAVFPLPSGSLVNKIVRGPMGKLWFTDAAGKIGTIDSSGNIVEYSLRVSDSRPQGIALGSDGNAWFTERNTNKIGRITPTGVITEYNVPTQPYAGVADMTNGPDGNLWFTEDYVGKIGRVTTQGVITELVVGGNPEYITNGPDHNLWFVDGSANQVGRLIPGVSVTKFQIPTAQSSPGNIIIGPNGSYTMWFGEASCNANNLASISLSGHVTEYPLPTTIPCGVSNVAAGPDGNIWMAACCSAPRAIEVYLLAAINTMPQSVSVSIGDSQVVTVSEPGYANTFTATSSNAAVASVSSGTSRNTFLVKGLSTGSCIILIADKRGNSVPVPTSVN